MQIDPLNDALIKMYNAEQAGKFNVELTPASKLLGNVLEIMQKSGYVGSIDELKTVVVEPTWLNYAAQSTVVALLSHDTVFVVKNTTNGRHATCLLKILVS